MEAMLQYFYPKSSGMKNSMIDFLTCLNKFIPEYSPRKSFLFFFILLLYFPLHAQPSRISGMNPDYAGKKLYVYTLADEISRVENDLGSIEVNDSGNYSFTVTLDETKKIFIPLGAYKGILYIEPGYSYHTILPPFTEKPEKETLNPYYLEPEIQIGVLSFKKQDSSSSPVELNQMIYSVDTTCEKLVNKILFKGTVIQNELSDMLTSIDTIYAASKNDFFLHYKKCRAGMLTYINNPEQPTENIIKEYFNSDTLYIDNPAYMDLFHKIFDFFFSNFKDNITRLKLFESGINHMSYKQLRDAFFIQNLPLPNELTDLIALNEINADLFSGKYPQENLLMMADSVSVFSPNTTIMSVANNIRNEFTKMIPGNTPPPFNLKGLDNKEYSPDSFKGKYIYLNFCSTLSFTCQKDFSVLDSLQKRYQNVLKVVTILVDKDFSGMLNYIKEEKSDRLFLLSDGDYGVIKKYKIKAYPTYFLIDPEGKFIYSPAVSPAEGFEINFYQLLKSKGIRGF